MEGRINGRNLCLSFVIILNFGFLVSCNEQKEHIAPGIYPKDSVAMMTTLGVNTLISDSGVIKYRIVAEQWKVNQNLHPSRWIFDKGLFLEQFDEKFHVQSYIQCDTAYYYDTQRIWELLGRVRILTKDGLRFSSEQLFWDENKHELYSYMFSNLITPTRQLQGTYFRSDEHMTHYFVSNSKGSFEKDDFDNNNDTSHTTTDTARGALRQRILPQPRNVSIPLTH